MHERVKLKSLNSLSAKVSIVNYVRISLGEKCPYLELFWSVFSGFGLYTAHNNSEYRHFLLSDDSEKPKVKCKIVASFTRHCTKMKFSMKYFFSKCDQIRSHFNTPWKRQKTKGFLTFPGAIEMPADLQLLKKLKHLLNKLTK